MSIRSFDIADAQSISEWLAQDASNSWTINKLLAALDKPIYRCRVSVSDQQVTGLCLFTVVSDECNLIYIAVQPNRRQCGIGRLLIDDMCSQLPLEGTALTNQPAVNTIFLEVRASNTAAIALYRAAGFKEDGRRENYYPAVGISSANTDTQTASQREAALLFSLAIN